MSITNKEPLRFIHFVGYFFILVLISTHLFRGDYTIKALLISGVVLIPLITIATCFWQQKLSHQKIESSFGALFFTKNIVYTNLQSIELYIAVGSTDGPSVVNSLFMAMKFTDRKEHVGLFMKKDWDKCSAEEAVNEIKDIAKVTGVSVINASPQFKLMFQRQFNKEFCLS